jgi:hypothetical protein
MGKIARSAVTAAAFGILASLSAAPAAQAANDHDSCVGIIVSTEASAGTLDVNNYKALAGDGPFGEFVSFGAQLHEGSYEACVPQ